MAGLHIVSTRGLSLADRPTIGSIVFESNRLRGLPAAERMKVLMDLAYVITAY
jgi:hypothetical protein